MTEDSPDSSGFRKLKRQEPGEGRRGDAERGDAETRRGETRGRGSGMLKVAGGIAMVLGTLDPMEGCVLILPGSGLVALGVALGGAERRMVRYWIWAFILIAAGVSALFALSVVGGIGGKSGHSMWWGVLILPYPVGWLMALAGAVAGVGRGFKYRRQETGDRRGETRRRGDAERGDGEKG